jgi:hypothetical protein
MWGRFQIAISIWGRFQTGQHQKLGRAKHFINSVRTLYFILMYGYINILFQKIYKRSSKVGIKPIRRVMVWRV